MSFKDLKLTRQQILQLQQLLAEELKNQAQSELQNVAEGKAIAKALENVQVYVEAGKSAAFVQLKQPQLHKFEISPNDEVTGFTRADPKELARWQTDKVITLDYISEEHRQHFGQIQTDKTTGETYMLVPMEVNILLDKAEETPNAKRSTEQDAYKEETGPGETLYLYHDLEGHPCKLPQAALDQNPQARQVEPMPPESQLNWDYHMHEFAVPKLSFPFELQFGSMANEQRLKGGQVEQDIKMVVELEEHLKDSAN